MSQPIPADLDLNAIRAELAEIKDRFGDRHYRGETAWFSSMWANVGRHVPALLAEVERLRADEPWVSMIEQRDAALDRMAIAHQQRDDARLERDRYAEVVEAARQWRDAIKPCVCGNGDPHQYLVREGESALIVAVDRLTPGGTDG